MCCCCCFSFLVSPQQLVHYRFTTSDIFFFPSKRKCICRVHTRDPPHFRTDFCVLKKACDCEVAVLGKNGPMMIVGRAFAQPGEEVKEEEEEKKQSPHLLLLLQQPRPSLLLLLLKSRSSFYGLSFQAVGSCIRHVKKKLNSPLYSWLCHALFAFSLPF